MINRALLEGPQFITRRKDEVVVMSRQEYDKQYQAQRLSFGEFLAYHTPSFEGLDLTRDKDTGRDVDFSE